MRYKPDDSLRELGLHATEVRGIQLREGGRSLVYWVLRNFLAYPFSLLAPLAVFVKDGARS